MFIDERDEEGRDLAGLFGRYEFEFMEYFIDRVVREGSGDPY